MFGRPSDFVCILDIMGTTHEHVDYFFTQANHYISSHHFFTFFPSIRLKQIQAITTRFVVSSRLFVAKFYSKLFWGECSKNFHERSSCLPTEIMPSMNGMYFSQGSSNHPFPGDQAMRIYIWVILMETIH